MKKRTIKITGLVLLLSLLFALLYFLVFPSRFRILQLMKIGTAQELKDKKQCFDDGIKSYNLEIGGDDYSQSGITPFPPIFKYDNNLNTCLYAGGFIYGKDKNAVIRYFIKDIYSNKNIAWTTIFPGNIEASEQWDEVLKKHGLYN